MPNVYLALFHQPGALAFSGAGFIARLPAAMMTLGIVTMLSQSHGAYGLAGSVAAVFAMSNALVAPQISRLVDRKGQARILVPAMLVTVAAVTGLLLATRFKAPVWTLFLFALIAGATPSIGAMVRARWTQIYRNTPSLRTAFAFESIVDEVIFIIGPIVAIGLSVSLFPEAGPLAAMILLALGVLLLSAQRATEPPIHAQEARGGISVIRVRPVQLVVFVMVAIGAIFGTAEVTAVAFAEAQGQKAAASLVLASYAAGSLIVGLVFGALRLQMPLAKQFLLAIMLSALTTLPLLAVDGLPTLAVVLFLAGGSVSPTIIVAMGLIERLVPPSKLTEGITWAMTGIGLGMAFGSAASGWLIDAYGSQAGFWVSVAAGGVAVLATLAGYRCLSENMSDAEARQPLV